LILQLEKKIIGPLALLCAALCIFGCASLKSPGQLHPLSQTHIALLKKTLNSQTYAVKTFISTGGLEIRDSTRQIPTTFLCIGSRIPFRLKVEITHTWGLPLIHILIQGQEVTVRDLYHHRIYQGHLSPHAPFLGKMPLLDKALLWSIMRAYPEIMDSGEISWEDDDRALVVKRKGKIAQEIRFDRDLRYPSSVSYPQLEVDVRFSQFTTNGHITYAKLVEATHLENNSSMRLTIKNIVFNPTLDPNLFNL